MKQTIIEIRKLISIKLLMLSLDIMPKSLFKMKLAVLIKDSIMTDMDKNQ